MWTLSDGSPFMYFGRCVSELFGHVRGGGVVVVVIQLLDYPDTLAVLRLKVKSIELEMSNSAGGSIFVGSVLIGTSYFLVIIPEVHGQCMNSFLDLFNCQSTRRRWGLAS